MIERLPDNLRTPAAARAITLPSAILAAGAGASVAILAGVPVLGAAAVGAVCWAGRVVLALPRRPRAERIDPATVREPWRTLVRKSTSARDRFDRAVRETSPGPLHDRLGEVAARVAEGAAQCWQIARRGDALDRAVAELDADDIRRQLDECHREAGRGRARPDLEATAEALRHQLVSAQRLASVADDARDRLRRLDAQLDEAVARAIELSLAAADAGALAPLGSDVDGLVGELESLRQALEETRVAEPPAGSGGRRP